MTNITLIHAERFTVEPPHAPAEVIWRLTLEVVQNGDTRHLVVEAPGDLTREQLTDHITANAARYAAWASEVGQPADAIRSLVNERALLRAILELAVEQFNTLRSAAGLPALTPAQVRQALIQKLQEQ